MEFKVGLEAIAAYKRLPYTVTHALAEFIDNATQAYFNNKSVLDAALRDEGEHLEVSITYDRATRTLRVVDNSSGMTLEELTRALEVGKRPPIATGRSRYGLGMKTAAFWLGNEWTIITKALGGTEEYTVTLNLDRIASGNATLEDAPPIKKSPTLHYTILEIRQINRQLSAGQIRRIKNYLGSMYREDIAAGIVLLWEQTPLTFEGFDERLLRDAEGVPYKKAFQFSVEGKQVSGWVGVLESGSRADAGFSIIHSGRVIKGWPDSWRPHSLFGQDLGSNDLVNQRLVGEVRLDDFEVTHTKDNIYWQGDEESEVERLLAEVADDYRRTAREYRKRAGSTTAKFSTQDIDAVVDELTRELGSVEMQDAVALHEVPQEDLIKVSVQSVVDSVVNREETFTVRHPTLTIRGYLAYDLSTSDPYVSIDSADPAVVKVVINMSHPAVEELPGPSELLLHIRNCALDAIAEWKAQRQNAPLNPATIRYLKDDLMRVSMQIVMNRYEADSAIGRADVKREPAQA
jgi:Histidine kinase-, DNA gyrase B-, and HSP90-like ATPase